jgi:hypothetical protein
MAMSETETVNNVEYLKHTFVAPEKAINIIFNDNGGNQTNDITGVTKTTYYRLNSTSGRTDVTVITPTDTPETPESLTYNVTVPEGTPLCYIVGAFNNWNVANAPLMTKIDDTHYTITLDNVTKASEYKYTCGQSWDYVELKADRTDVPNRTWSESDVVEAWKDIPNSGLNSTIDSNLTVYGANGTINITAAQPTQVAIYNAQGILVALANANGNTTIELPRGLYIVNGNKVLVY